MLAIKNLPVYFILIIAPVLYHVDRSLPGITAGFTGVLLIILCSVFFLKYKKFRFNLLDLFFLLFVVWYTGRTVGIGSSMHAWKLLLGCTAVLLYAYIRNVGLERHYFDILFVVGVFQAGWYFVQLQGILPLYHYLFPGTGGFMNPAILAIFLAVACLSGIIGFYREEKLYLRCFRGIGIALLVFALGWLGSRAAWVGLSLGVLWVVLTGREWGFSRFLVDANRKSRWGKYILFLLVLVVPVSAMYILYLVHLASVQGRFLIW